MLCRLWDYQNQAGFTVVRTTYRRDPAVCPCVPEWYDVAARQGKKPIRVTDGQTLCHQENVSPATWTGTQVYNGFNIVCDMRYFGMTVVWSLSD
jgi:hypothetical protein